MIGYLKIAQPSREHMRKDVAAYMRYYNPERRHTENGDQSPSNEVSEILKEHQYLCVNAKEKML